MFSVVGSRDCRASHGRPAAAAGQRQPLLVAVAGHAPLAAALGHGSRAGWTAQASTANGQRAANTHAPAAVSAGADRRVGRRSRRSCWTESGRSCLTLGADAISSAV